MLILGNLLWKVFRCGTPFSSVLCFERDNLFNSNYVNHIFRAFLFDCLLYCSTCSSISLTKIRKSGGKLDSVEIVSSCETSYTLETSIT